MFDELYRDMLILISIKLGLTIMASNFEKRQIPLDGCVNVRSSINFFGFKIDHIALGSFFQNHSSLVYS